MTLVRPLRTLHEIIEFSAGDTLLVSGISNVGFGNLTFQDDFANGGSPITLTQLFAGSAGTFLGLTDTPAAFVADQVVTVNSLGTALEFTAPSAGTWLGLADTIPVTFTGQAGRIPTVNALETALGLEAGVSASAVLCAEPGTSGVLIPGDGELQFESVTQVRIKAGSSNIVDRSPGAIATCRPITWPDIVHTIGNISGSGAFYAIEDPTTSGTGSVFESSVPLTTTERRGRARLGVTFHQSGALIGQLNNPDIWHDHANLVNDALSSTDAVKVTAGVTKELAGTLTFESFDHNIFSRSINFHTALGDQNPSKVILTGSTPSAQVFDLIDGTGVAFSTAITSLPKQWNNAGTLTNLTGKNAVVHQLAVSADGSWWVQAGTTSYKSFAEATASIGLEFARNPLWPVLQAIGERRYVAVIAGDTGTAWEESKAELLPVFRSGGDAGGVSTYLDLGDTESSYATHGGKFLAVTGAEDAVEFVAAPTAVVGVPAVELIESVDAVLLSTSPGPITYDVTDFTNSQGFLSYLSPEVTADKACHVLVHLRADYNVNSAHTVAGLRLDLVYDGITVQVYDEQSEKSTDSDGQCQGFAFVHMAVGKKLQVLCNSYITGRVDVAGGANRMTIIILEDETP